MNRANPLTNIAEPGPNDVLCGRGGAANNHIGNRRFRMLVNEHRCRYLEAGKLDKPKVAREVMVFWRRQTPPGRFLQKDPVTKLWNDVGDQKAREKASQCLRERNVSVEVQPHQSSGRKLDGEIEDCNFEDSGVEKGAEKPAHKDRDEPMAMDNNDLSRQHHLLREQVQRELMEQQEQLLQLQQQQVQVEHLFMRQQNLASYSTGLTHDALQKQEELQRLQRELQRRREDLERHQVALMRGMQPTQHHSQRTQLLRHSSSSPFDDGRNSAFSSFPPQMQRMTSDAFLMPPPPPLASHASAGTRLSSLSETEEHLKMSSDSGWNDAADMMDNVDTPASIWHRRNSSRQQSGSQAGMHFLDSFSQSSGNSGSRRMDFERSREWATMSNRSSGLRDLLTLESLAMDAGRSTLSDDKESMDGIKSLLSSSQSGSIIGQTNSLRNIINDKESLDGIKSILSSSHSGSLTRDLICPSNSLRHIINMNENAAFSQVFQPLGFNLGDEASWTNKSRISSEQSRLRTSKATIAGASTLSGMSEITDSSAEMTSIDVAMDEIRSSFARFARTIPRQSNQPHQF